MNALPNDELNDRAKRLGCSQEAMQLAWQADIIDLHLDTFIPHRLWGYDLHAHNKPLLGRYFLGHVDIPRLTDGCLSGAMWSITTNPLRSAQARKRTLQRNVERLLKLFQNSGGKLEAVRTLEQYQAARARGAHACFVSIQGGNALEACPEGPAFIPGQTLVRITLVHLTNSALGVTSSPAHLVRKDKGLSTQGKTLVEHCNSQRVFVDLAHIHEQGFWDAVAVHDRSQPLLATHTGVCGVRPHWRNLNDKQLKAIAATGGTVGIIFSQNFLTRPGGPRDGRMIIEHMQHVIDTVGEDHVSIGSDYDGMIIPPPDLCDALTYPRLVQWMLDARWHEDRIRKVLAGNFLRCLKELRG